MTEPSAHEPIEDVDETEGVSLMSAVLVLATLASWAVVVIMAFTKYSDFDDRRNSFSISAPQISQIANEYMVELMPWFFLALGVTAVAIVSAVVSRP